MEFLVGAVNVVVGKAKAHEHSRNPQDLLKSVHHWNRTAGPNKDGQRSKALLIRKRRRTNRRMVAVHKRRLDGRECANRATHAGWSNALDMIAKEPRDRLRILVRH